MKDWLADLVGDPFIEDRLSPKRQIGDYLAVEAAFTEAAGFVGKFPEGLSREAADAILDRLSAAAVMAAE